MVKAAVLNLKNRRKWNRWVIGTPDEVPKSSPFYSDQIQIKYINIPYEPKSPEREKKHWHTPPIEEYYFVL